MLRPQVFCQPVGLVVGNVEALSVVHRVEHVLAHDQLARGGHQIARIVIGCRIAVCLCRIGHQRRLRGIRRAVPGLLPHRKGRAQRLPVQIRGRYRLVQIVIRQTETVIG